MKLLSPVLAEVAPGYVKWFCPGCQETHHIPVAAAHNPGNNWGWNLSADKPTFMPSVLVRSGHFSPHWKQGDGCWCDKEWGFKCHQCHVFVVDGQIQFLADCSHELAGRTVPMVPFPISRDTLGDSDGDDGA